MPDTLIKFKTGALSKLEGGATDEVSINEGTVYFATDSTDNTGKIWFDDSNGNRIDMTAYSQESEYAALANNVDGVVAIANGGTGVTTLEDIREEINVIDSKTYTDVIGSANNNAGAGFFYGKIRGTTYDAVWHVKVKVTASIPSSTAYFETSEFDLWGTANTYISYKSQNAIKSTSYRPIYYHCYFRINSTGYNSGGNGWLGFNLTSSANSTNTSYKRTVKIDLLEYENCTFEFIDTLYKASQLPNISTSGYYNSTYNSSDGSASFDNFDACNNGLKETGDDNTIDVAQITSGYLTNSSNFRLGPYSLFGLDKNDNTQGFSLYSIDYSSSTSNINTARSYNTAGVDWTKGLFYTASGSNFAKSVSLNWSFRAIASGIDFRYSDNCVANANATTLGMVARKLVYFRGVIKEDGLFYIAPFNVTYNNATYPRAWTQDIPTQVETDGTYQYVYWLVGIPYYNGSYAGSLYQIDLLPENKMYWYHNGKFEEYIQPIATTTTDGLISASDKTKLDGIAMNANNYSHPTTTATTAAAVKVGKDNLGHVVLGSALTASDVGAATSGHNHDDTYLKKSGGTLTGALTLNADPTANLEAATKQYVDNAFAINDAMVFKGVLNSSSGIPDTHQAGWTYRIGTTGTYAGNICEVGDLLICVADGTTASDNDWVSIQNNIDGALFKGTNTFTDGQVLAADGVTGKVKTTGYTIAKSVPSNAVFTDTVQIFWVTYNSTTASQISSAISANKIPILKYSNSDETIFAPLTNKYEDPINWSTVYVFNTKLNATNYKQYTLNGSTWSNSSNKILSTISQTLTTSEKTQVRTNIGAAASSDIPTAETDNNVINSLILNGFPIIEESYLDSAIVGTNIVS